MHIAPDNVLVSCTIALFLGGWSFLLCYFLFTKFPYVFFTIGFVLGLLDFATIIVYLIGLMVIVLSSVIGFLTSIIHHKLEKETGMHSKIHMPLFWLYFVASQLPYWTINLFFYQGASKSNSAISSYLMPFVMSDGDSYSLILILFIAPSLGLIPLYMFKTYRPRPGMDTHFPDVENN